MMREKWKVIQTWQRLLIETKTTNIYKLLGNLCSMAGFRTVLGFRTGLERYCRIESLFIWLYILLIWLGIAIQGHSPTTFTNPKCFFVNLFQTSFILACLYHQTEFMLLSHCVTPTLACEKLVSQKKPSKIQLCNWPWEVHQGSWWSTKRFEVQSATSLLQVQPGDMWFKPMVLVVTCALGRAGCNNFIQKNGWARWFVSVFFVAKSWWFCCFISLSGGPRVDFLPYLVMILLDFEVDFQISLKLCLGGGFKYVVFFTPI